MRKRSPELQATMDFVIGEIEVLSPTNVQRILALWDDMEDEELIENLCNHQNLYHDPGKEPTKQVLQKMINRNRVIVQERFRVYDTNPDDPKGILTAREACCYILPIRRNQQISAKESSVATKAEVRDITNQVTGEDKKAQHSDTEIATTIAHGGYAINRELMGAASHDMVAKSVYRDALSQVGEISLKDLPNNPENKKSLILIDQVLKMMGYDSDLVSTPLSGRR